MGTRISREKKKSLTTYVHPRCGYCHKLRREIERSEEMRDAFEFVDCVRYPERCPDDLRAYPMTCNANGECVVGYRAPPDIKRRLA